MDLIIGAGISGLSYANFTNNDYIIIEKDAEIGGYCKTIKQDGFVWDYSGHFFHFRNKEIQDYILSCMEEQEILRVEKKSQVYYKGNYIDFPFQKNIHQLEKDEFVDCLYDLFYNDFTKMNTFKEMLYAKFGKSIAEKFLIPYNEKLYAVDVDKLDIDAMGRFFPYADKLEIIKNFKHPDSSSYNATFTYPRGGAIEYVNSLFKRIDDNKLELNEQLIKIDFNKKIAKTNTKEIKYDRIISSIPLPSLINLCQIDCDINNFSWNQVLVFNLGFDKKGADITNNWVYFPEQDYCFYRIGYYDNIFDDNRLSLYVELGFDKQARINQDELLKRVLIDLQKANIITDHKLISYHSVVMNPAYVHVSKNSEREKNIIKEKLEKNEVYSIGRYGDWKYCSIEDNIIEAKELALKINSNKY
ncbi:protoporphyrinogen/coproporphyrinogen oxidase [Flavobacterium croceum]|uniref:protoporphyrinogen/coproporphyrinogen oxidase n=1 Tax=Flavobacterium croceum TaxID=370975 RepID=UPI0024A86F45|nr:FAD-dependent oxidoreductase [Flavobacterium croceum]